MGNYFPIKSTKSSRTIEWLGAQTGKITLIRKNNNLNKEETIELNVKVDEFPYTRFIDFIKVKCIAENVFYRTNLNDLDLYIDNVDAEIAKKLVAIGNKIRNLTELGLTETVSTRLLVDAAKIIHSGLPKRLSVHVAIVEPLTDDLQTVEALKDLCNLMI